MYRFVLILLLLLLRVPNGKYIFPSNLKIIVMKWYNTLMKMVSQESMLHMQLTATIHQEQSVLERRTWSFVQLQESPAHLWWFKTSKVEFPLWEWTVSWRAAPPSPSPTRPSSNSVKTPSSTAVCLVFCPGSLISTICLTMRKRRNSSVEREWEISTRSKPRSAGRHQLMR